MKALIRRIYYWWDSLADDPCLRPWEIGRPDDR